jgi:hypothetical protein
MRFFAPFVVVIALAAVSPAARQLQTPTDWKWRTDAPAKVTSESKITPDTWHFVAMPPGWHITMGPGGLLYPSGKTASGNFTLQAEMFLFPGDGQQEYGLFLGGQAIEPATATPQYVAFVARRDGQAAILKRTGGNVEPLVAWKANDAVVPHAGGDGTAKNILRVEAGPAEIAFSANGKEIARVPRAGLATDGTFGFRVGKDLNMHISTLDVTQRLAPIPVKK